MPRTPPAPKKAARTRKPPAPKKHARGPGRRKSALQLRTEGFTFEEIGRRLGITRQAAHKLVQTELVAVADENRDLAGHVLEGELERVDFVLRSLAPKVEKGDPKAAQAYLRAMERRARLLGLDAPTRTDGTTKLTGPDGGPVALEVAATEPAALHARIAAAVARATRGPDPGGAGADEPAGTGGDPRGAGSA